jgi:hypothetical protein
MAKKAIKFYISFSSQNNACRNSPSGGSNNSGPDDQQSLLSGSGTSLVRKMQQLMNDIKN